MIENRREKGEENDITSRWIIERHKLCLRNTINMKNNIKLVCEIQFASKKFYRV